jgi:hypothetical protein
LRIIQSECADIETTPGLGRLLRHDSFAQIECDEPEQASHFGLPEWMPSKRMNDEEGYTNLYEITYDHITA